MNQPLQIKLDIFRKKIEAKCFINSKLKSPLASTVIPEYMLDLINELEKEIIELESKIN